MDELEGLIKLVQSGASQAEISTYLRDNQEAISGLSVGALGDAISQAGLTSEQSSTLNKAYTRVIVPGEPGQDLLGQTGLLGGGVGVQALKGLATTGAGGTVAVGASQLTKLLPIGASPLLRKAVELIFGGGAKSAVKKIAGVTAVAGAAFSTIQGAGDEIIDPAGFQDPQEGPAPTAPTGGDPRARTPGEIERRQQFGGATPQVEGTTGLPPDQGFNIMVVDHDGSLTGTPGAIAVVTSAEIGMTPGIDPLMAALISSQATVSGADPLVFLRDFMTTTGQSASTADREVMQVLFPESLGQVNIGTPFQVSPGEEEVPSTFPRFQDPKRREQAGLVARTGVGDLPPPEESPGVDVPAGATLSPRIFTNFQGRTLMEWASISAQRHDVPLNLLYGIVDHESGWSQRAIGDNGTSFGLAQIHLPAWPNISREAALNPVFALEWTASKLRERFNQFGRWDAAVAAHNSPQAAQHLSETGKFFNEKSADYVLGILNTANASGLAQYQFETGGEAPETSGIGPTFTPFQSPDPAQSREYIRGVYEELLGRNPTEGEFKKGVGEILQLSRSSYAANLRQAKGSESEAVDVGAQFEQSIRESGEFAFTEEVEEQDSFTDFASGVARLLQQGI